MENTKENKKISILMIDDDSFLLDMYSLKFSKRNFDVHVAHDSEIALKLIHDGLVVDILLIDIVIPGMDGIELIEILKKENLITNSLVIMLTNQGLPKDIARAKKLNVDGYIIKASTVPSDVLNEVSKIYAARKK